MRRLMTLCTSFRKVTTYMFLCLHNVKSLVLPSLRREIDRLPRLGGGVAGRDGAVVRIVALLDRDPDPSFSYLVRIRADAEAEDTQNVGVRGRVDPDDPRRIVFRVSRALIPSSRFQIQLSVMNDPRGWPFSEPWQWATAP